MKPKPTLNDGAPPPAASVILATTDTKPDVAPVTAQDEQASADSHAADAPDPVPGDAQQPKPRADDVPGPCSPPKTAKPGGWRYSYFQPRDN